MLNKNLIKTKIRSIQEYLVEIEPILSLPKDQVVSNIEKLRALERNFQLIVDAMLDINIHFIKELELLAKKDDVEVIKKYLNYWEPMKFIQASQVEKVVKELLSEMGLIPRM